MKKTKNIALLYSFFLAILSIINLYQSWIPVITAGELGLILFSGITLLIMLISKKISFGKNSIKVWPINFFIIFLFLTCISIVLLGNGTVSTIDIFNRFIRLALWAFSISFMGYYLFDYNYAKKWLIRIAVLATIYIVAQYVFWQAFNIYLPSVVNNAFIHPVSEGYADTARLTEKYARRFIRPVSFFGEPAFYSYYTLIGLVLILFQSVGMKNRVKYFASIFLSVGIIISTSTAGIYLMLLVWGYYFYHKTKGKDRVVKVVRMTILAIPMILLLLVIFSVLYYGINTGDAFSKLQVVLSKPFEFVTNTRLGGSYSIFNKLEGMQRFIGVGFGNQEKYLDIESVYYNSVTNLLLSAGYVGLTVFALFAVNLLRNKEPFKLILAVIYLLLCFTSSILYSAISVIYLTIIFYADNSKINKRIAKDSIVNINVNKPN